MTGVDGKWLVAPRLAVREPFRATTRDALVAVCRDIGGMDCSEFVLQPCALRPGVLVMMPDGSIGMTEFESIGYCPKDWMLMHMALDVVREKPQVLSSLQALRRACAETWDPKPRASSIDHNEWTKGMFLSHSLVGVYEHALSRWDVKLRESHRPHDAG